MSTTSTSPLNRAANRTAAAFASLLVSTALLGAVLLGFDHQTGAAAGIAQQATAVRIG